MANINVFILVIPLLLAACSSANDSDSVRQDRIPSDAPLKRSPWPDPYNNKQNQSPEQRRAISQKIRADRLEARGRRDNSTDSGDGFGQPLQPDFYRKATGEKTKH